MTDTQETELVAKLALGNPEQQLTASMYVTLVKVSQGLLRIQEHQARVIMALGERFLEIMKLYSGELVLDAAGSAASIEKLEQLSAAANADVAELQRLMNLGTPSEGNPNGR